MPIPPYAFDDQAMLAFPQRYKKNRMLNFRAFDWLDVAGVRLQSLRVSLFGFAGGFHYRRQGVRSKERVVRAGVAVRWRLAWFLVLPITWIMSLDRTAMTVAAPVIQKDMHFTLTQMSWILTAFHWAYAICSIPAGIFTAWAGARLALLIANAAWSALTLAIPFAAGATALSALRFALGGFQAVDMPASVTAFKAWFPVEERARANSALLAGVYLGPIVGAPLAAWLTAGYGWRAAFLIFGGLGVISAILWWFVFRNTPQEHPAVSDRERSLIGQGQMDDAGPGTPASLRGLAGRLAFWTIGLQGVCTGVVMGFFNTWLPTYLMQERGVALKSLGIFSSLPWMILLLVVFAASVIEDAVLKRTKSVWLARVPPAMFGFVIAAVGLWLTAKTSSTGTALALLAMGLGGMGFVQASTWSTIQEVGGSNTSILAAWNGMLTNGAAALGPLLMAGLVSRQGNWAGALTGVALTAIAGALTWSAIHRRAQVPA
jgi:ACS family glucarate transporter-like MFS transporter